MGNIHIPLHSNIRAHRRTKRDERGMILVSALIITTVLMMVGFTLISAVAGQYSLANDNVYADNAILTAEAGIEQSIEQLNQSDSFAGYTSAQTLFNNSTQGYGVFTSTVTNNTDNSNAKTIVAKGSIYYYGQTTNPVSSRTVRVTVVGTQSSGYSVFTGPGGLILSGSGAITNSPVYVNGTITMSGASSIGTQSQPLTVDAGNIACPSGGGSGWPQLCTSSQPISMAQSTRIYGSVCATGQTSTGPNNNIQSGNGGSGLEIGCTAPSVSEPTYDRTAQINAVTTTASSTNSAYDCTQWNSTNGFSRTWPANLELTGNVNIASSCNLTLTGDVYITGNLTIGGAAKIGVANTDANGNPITTRPVIIVDGTINVAGSGSMIANSSGTGAEFISFKSANPCTTATPTNYCNTISGTDLYNSQSQTTVTVGGGAASLAGFVFDAYWGEIDVTGSGNVGAALGQTVNMSGSGTVTFGTKVGAGAQTWTISSYQIIPNSS